MIEEPYRWVEAIATRRDYIETQLSSGSPIIALTYAGGILLFTVGQQKLFEIYDRIAIGAIGHPGDIERLRMVAIELASTEGFARAAADVSLRRLAYYSLSPVLKNAFEQIYGAPFLARLLFAEIGATPEEDLFLRVEYDGAISQGKSGNTPFAVLAATKKSAEQMEQFLEREHHAEAPLADVLGLAFDTWMVGQKVIEQGNALPSRNEVRGQRRNRAGDGTMAAVVLERAARSAQQYRALSEAEFASLS